MIPTKFTECNDALNAELSADEKIDFMLLKREDLIRTHHVLGCLIRNKWGLWTQAPLYTDMVSLGFSHPDDMSATIIKEYWLYLNNLPSEISEDLKRYNEHWNNIKKNEEK